MMMHTNTTKRPRKQDPTQNQKAPNEIPQNLPELEEGEYWVSDTEGRLTKEKIEIVAQFEDLYLTRDNKSFRSYKCLNLFSGESFPVLVSSWTEALLQPLSIFTPEYLLRLQRISEKEVVTGFVVVYRTQTQLAFQDHTKKYWGVSAEYDQTPSDTPLTHLFQTIEGENCFIYPRVGEVAKDRTYKEGFLCSREVYEEMQKQEVVSLSQINGITRFCVKAYRQSVEKDMRYNLILTQRNLENLEAERNQEQVEMKMLIGQLQGIKSKNETLLEEVERLKKTTVNHCTQIQKLEQKLLEEREKNKNLRNRLPRGSMRNFWE